MDGPHFTWANSSRIGSSTQALRQIARLATALGAALVLCLCVVVVMRGLLGALQPPASSWSLVFAAVAAELFACLFRIFWRSLHPYATPRRVLLETLAGPALCIVCVAVAMSMTGANAWAVGSVWLVFAAAEFAWWYPQLRALRDGGVAPTAAGGPRAATEAVNDAATEADAGEDASAIVMQQMTRTRDDEGVEVISGVLRAEFAAGERSHQLHVAFCPPLAYEPTVEAHQLNGSPLAIKVAQAEVFGTRIELRRGGTAGTSENATLYFEVQPGEAAKSTGPG